MIELIHAWLESEYKLPGVPTIDCDVFVTDVRLVRGKNKQSGRVEIYHRGEWGGVCANSGVWGNIEASVICRQLGFR